MSKIGSVSQANNAIDMSGWVNVEMPEENLRLTANDCADSVLFVMHGQQGKGERQNEDAIMERRVSGGGV